MISSPGCQWRTRGASGPISTRFWITSCPGTPRSWCWRSVRQRPGACCTAVIGCLLRSRSAERLERGAHLLAEELRLLPGGEVPAALGAVDVDQRRIRAPRPRFRRQEAVLPEDGDADGHGDLRDLDRRCT